MKLRLLLLFYLTIDFILFYLFYFFASQKYSFKTVLQSAIKKKKKIEPTNAYLEVRRTLRYDQRPEG